MRRVPSGPAVGPAYLAYYAADDGIRRWDAAAGADRLVLPAADVDNWARSTDGNRLAVAYRRGDSVGLAIIDTPAETCDDFPLALAAMNGGTFARLPRQ